jgi:hypothetical protein
MSIAHPIFFGFRTLGLCGFLMDPGSWTTYYSNNSTTGLPVHELGKEMFMSTDKVGAISVMSWYLADDPFLTPLPKNRTGT